MKMKPIKRVNREAVQRVLKHQQGTAAEVILRFAWQMGLIPEEMHGVKWSDVDFEEGVVRLPDRSIPMEDDARICLESWLRKYSSKLLEYVLITESRRHRMSRAYIFRCARAALEKEGLADISLMDLRHDFIVYQLEQHSRPYVAKIAGVTISTLDTAFSQYTKAANKCADRAVEKIVDTDRLTEFILQNPLAPERLSLWMAWKQKLTVRDLAGLTWEQVDPITGTLSLKDRRVPADEQLRGWLQQLRDSRAPDDDPHIILTPNSRKPFDEPRLSRVVKEALIKAGLDQLTPLDLAHEETDSILLRYMEETGSVTRDETAALLQVSKGAAWGRLHRMAEEGKVIRIGARYYRAGRVVPPEKQYETIRAHLEEVGGAYRKELSEILGVEPQQSTWILHGFVKAGKLVRMKQRYTLPSEVTWSHKDRG